MATKVTVCSAVRCVGSSIMAVYLNLTTSVKTFLLTTNDPNGQLTLPRSQVVVRRPVNNAKQRHLRTDSVTVRTGRVLQIHRRLGRVVTHRANGPVRRVRGSASHSCFVSTRRTTTCNLVSGIVRSHGRRLTATISSAV